MPRSFLIRKSHSKIDCEQYKLSDEGVSTEILKAYTSKSPANDAGLEKPDNDQATTLGVNHSSEMAPFVVATAEIDTVLKSTFQCDHCCRSFNRASDLKRHQLAHIDAKPYRCRICDRQFTWLGNFQKHCASHVEFGSSRQTPAAFYAETPLDVFRACPPSIFYGTSPYGASPFGASPYGASPYGAVYFENISGPALHPEYSNPRGLLGQRGLVCDICRLTFTTSRALKMHTRIHTGEKPYKCSQCNKAFARKDELHTHKYFHTGEKPFKCDKCPASFVRFGHLQRHRFVHYDVKPYQCKLCPKSFTQYRNLQTHMYKHTGERPFRCKYCPKGFTQYGTLQAHERTHTGERPFVCKTCEKRFITSSHLRWHVRTQHV